MTIRLISITGWWNLHTLWTNTIQSNQGEDEKFPVCKLNLVLKWQKMVQRVRLRIYDRTVFAVHFWMPSKVGLFTYNVWKLHRLVLLVSKSIIQFRTMSKARIFGKIAIYPDVGQKLNLITDISLSKLFDYLQIIWKFILNLSWEKMFSVGGGWCQV